MGEVVRLDLAHTIRGRGRYWTTAYWVDGLLVDTGCAHSAPELVSWVRDHPVTRVVNTHSHEDHFGGNAPLLAAWPGLPVLAHADALPFLEDPSLLGPLQWYRRQFWGLPGPSRGMPLREGDVVRTPNHTFHVIHTPGHTPDHICLHEPERGWLFSGDLYVGGKDRALRSVCDIWGIITSLRKVAALPVERLFPGSASVPPDARKALWDKVAYLEDLGRRVLAEHARGASVPTIARRLLGRPMRVELVTWGDFSRRWLVRSYLRQARPGAPSPRAGP
jgi:glyoxylase-like metal-dependent hydrolase (beta-lactamase superfamily II)